MGVTQRSSWWWMGIVGVVVLGAGAMAIAAKESSHSKEKATANTEAAAKATLARETQARLNGTEWAIELSPLSGGPAKRPIKDTLRFEQSRVSSQQLAKSGFPASNYTVSIGNDGVSVWETMQTAEDASVVFWRGEVRGETMRGILSKHPAKGEVTDLAFSGTLTSGSPAGPATPERKTAR